MASLYKIVGEEGDYQIMEQFGQYRISKKKYKTKEAAKTRIEQIGGVVKS